MSCFSISAQSELVDILPKNENLDSIMLIHKQIKAANIAQMAAADIQYFIIKARENTFGYAIFVDGNMAIQQTTIPSLPGNYGFKNTEDAAKVAELVIKKMKEGEIPPTLNENDLREINVIH